MELAEALKKIAELEREVAQLKVLVSRLMELGAQQATLVDARSVRHEGGREIITNEGFTFIGPR